MNIDLEKVAFYIPKVLKNTTKSFYSKPIDLKAYEFDESICFVRIVVEYIKTNEQLRKS